MWEPVLQAGRDYSFAAESANLQAVDSIVAWMEQSDKTSGSDFGQPKAGPQGGLQGWSPQIRDRMFSTKQRALSYKRASEINAKNVQR